MTRTDRHLGIVVLLLSVLALALWHTGRHLARGIINAG